MAKSWRGAGHFHPSLRSTMPVATTWQTLLLPWCLGLLQNWREGFSYLTQMRGDSGGTLFSWSLGAEPVGHGRSPGMSGMGCGASRTLHVIVMAGVKHFCLKSTKKPFPQETYVSGSQMKSRGQRSTENRSLTETIKDQDLEKGRRKEPRMQSTLGMGTQALTSEPLSTIFLMNIKDKSPAFLRQPEKLS